MTFKSRFNEIRSDVDRARTKKTLSLLSRRAKKTLNSPEIYFGSSSVKKQARNEYRKTLKKISSKKKTLNS